MPGMSPPSMIFTGRHVYDDVDDAPATVVTPPVDLDGMLEVPPVVVDGTEASAMSIDGSSSDLHPSGPPPTRPTPKIAINGLIRVKVLAPVNDARTRDALRSRSVPAWRFHRPVRIPTGGRKLQTYPSTSEKHWKGRKGLGKIACCNRWTDWSAESR